jgi:hypothetical protein
MVETTILKVIPIVVICIGLIVGGFVYFSNVNDSKGEAFLVKEHSYSIPPYSEVQPEVSEEIWYDEKGNAYAPINLTWQEVTQCFNLYKQKWESCN